MHDVFTPLTDDELAKLDDFLLNRFDDESEADDKDEGIYDASSLDGFFTAIVSGPVMIPPSQWMPALWGDFEPVWESENDFATVFSLLMRHMNSIASHLIDDPESFEPLFTEHVVEDQTHTIVDDWCYGYMIGVTVELGQWQTDTIDMQILLAPLMVFGTEEGRSKLEDLNEQETENIRKVITSNVREIYAYWLARREQYVPTLSTVERSEPHVGRNDLCPCGSGKKYKKCCLH